MVVKKRPQNASASGVSEMRTTRTTRRQTAYLASRSPPKSKVKQNEKHSTDSITSKTDTIITDISTESDLNPVAKAFQPHQSSKTTNSSSSFAKVASTSKEEITSSTDEDDDMSVGSYRSNRYYITIKFDTYASPTYLEDIRSKYLHLFQTLQEVDEGLLLKGVNPLKNTTTLSDPNHLPTRNIGLNKYFLTTSRPPKANKNEGKGMMWATALICTEESYDDLAAASHYDLGLEGVVMMKKRLQCCKSITPAYFQFMDNRADPDDIRRQIMEDIGETWDWVLFNRKPWEGYNQKKEEDKKKEYLAKCLHVECKEGDKDAVCNAIREWIKSGYAALRFGTHLKLVEEIKPDTPIQQVDRTVRINGHGRRFQASIAMVELTGLLNPNGFTSDEGNKSTIREEIIDRVTDSGEPIFLAVTKKWGSILWQGTYVKKHKALAQDFASCPAAWLAHEIYPTPLTHLYKHFSPEAVLEAKSSNWDEETQRIVTKSEVEDNAEESVMANISWLIDASHLDDEGSDTEVSFKSGVHFNFADDISVNTTRINTTGNNTPPSKGSSSPASPPSILKTPSDSMTISSDITTESRIKVLESGMEQILKYVQAQTQPSISTSSANTGQGTTTSSSSSSVPPASSQGEAGE